MYWVIPSHTALIYSQSNPSHSIFFSMTSYLHTSNIRVHRMLPHSETTVDLFIAQVNLADQTYSFFLFQTADAEKNPLKQTHSSWCHLRRLKSLTPFFKLKHQSRFPHTNRSWLQVSAVTDGWSKPPHFDLKQWLKHLLWLHLFFSVSLYILHLCPGRMLPQNRLVRRT